MLPLFQPERCSLPPRELSNTDLQLNNACSAFLGELFPRTVQLDIY